MKANFVVSLTTTPTRIGKLSVALDSIFSQELEPVEVCLCIPFVYKRTGELYDIDLVDPKYRDRVTILRCEDVGPATKLVPTLKKYWGQKDMIICVVDDDMIYKPSLFTMFVGAMLRDGPNGKTAYASLCTNYYETSHCLMEAFQGYAVRVGYFRENFWSYLEWSGRNKSCYRSDDYVISHYLFKSDIRLVQMHDHVGSLANHSDIADKADALSTIDRPTPNRYNACRDYLE